jgi:hypothetical protein
VQEGDTLEIGVAGFPPARFAFVPSDAIDAVNWRPIGLAAYAANPTGNRCLVTRSEAKTLAMLGHTTKHPEGFNCE